MLKSKDLKSCCTVWCSWWPIPCATNSDNWSDCDGLWIH